MKTVVGENGHTWEIETVREWKNLKVMEINMEEGINGVSFPCKNPGEYRILINRDLTEREKLEVFIHEMIHLYRRDHDKPSKMLNRFEAECHQLTHEIMEALGL